MVMGFRHLIASQFLALKYLSVQTAGRLDRTAVFQMAGIRPGSSLLTLSLRGVRQRIEAHPLVEQAWVERDFPHTLKIRVQERQPVAIVVLDKRVLFMDRKGVLFPSAGPYSRRGYVPLTGLQEMDLETNPGACQLVLQAAVDLLTILKDYSGCQVVEVGLDLDRGLRLSLARGPSDIRLGFEDLGRKLGRLAKILDQLEREGRRGEILWIDLRYSKTATVKFNSKVQGLS